MSYSPASYCLCSFRIHSTASSRASHSAFLHPQPTRDLHRIAFNYLICLKVLYSTTILLPHPPQEFLLLLRLWSRSLCHQSLGIGRPCPMFWLSQPLAPTIYPSPTSSDRPASIKWSCASDCVRCRNVWQKELQSHQMKVQWYRGLRRDFTRRMYRGSVVWLYPST